MSDSPKRPYEQMYAVACGLVNRLRPACHRIEIAGSLRRQKAMVGDIELVAIPILHTDLFGAPLASSHVDTLLASWVPIRLMRNGPKQKQFTFYGKGGYPYVVDLFLQPDPSTWGVNFLLRTGDAEFSRKMVTPKWRGGFMPDGFTVQDARVWKDGVALETPEEIDVFRLFGMEFIAPEDRGERVRV